MNGFASRMKGKFHVVLAYFILFYSPVVWYEKYKSSVLFGNDYEIHRHTLPKWMPRVCMIRWGKEEVFSWSRARGESLHPWCPLCS